MNFLKDIYPGVDRELLESVWTVAEGNIMEALELLKSNLGADAKAYDRIAIVENEVAPTSPVMKTDKGKERHSSFEQALSVHSPPWTGGMQPNSTIASASSPPLRWPSRKQVPVQADESPVTALQTYIAVRQLVPTATFNVSFPN